ncbi:MAG TPA: enoyl-CoA hydratase/isomerase family protein [Pyrinomonadaceae bacterium]|nr:enoyl-CoA hydratase/isomerase family protein [Pyrinomonadaceae bacterium]
MSEDENEARGQSVVLELRSAIAVVRINRPAERNSLSVATLEELDSTVSALTTREDVSSIIFTGTRDVFAAGADIRELAQLNEAAAEEFAARGQRLFQKIADARQFTVAAVNGYCMGGGLDLALSCDVRCASPAAVFAHPGARLGIITGWGGTQRLPRLIGTARALEMFCTARRVEAREAYEIGLVSKLGEPVLECAVEIAARRLTS